MQFLYRTPQVRTIALLLLFTALPSLRSRGEDQPTSLVRGKPILTLDAEAAHAFDREYPNALPEFNQKVGKPSAVTFDWCQRRKNYNVHSQGSFATCWAHAAIGALEWNWLIRNNPTSPVILSAQPILDRTQKTGGGQISLVMDTLLWYGTTAAHAYPYTGEPQPLKDNVPTPFRTVAWGLVAPQPHPTAKQIKQALIEHGPLMAGICSTRAFAQHRGGLFREHYTPPEGQPKTNHAVLIVGWDDRRGQGAWKIQNSWGLKWGDRGFAWIEYGCNNIGYAAAWLKAQSVFYRLPGDTHTLLNIRANPFPSWPSAKKVDLPSEVNILSPADATRQKSGTRCAVEMNVKAYAAHKGAVAFLSLEDLHHPDCLFVVLPPGMEKQFGKTSVDHLLTCFLGKVIRVKGFLTHFKGKVRDGQELRETEERPKILVCDPGQIIEVAAPSLARILSPAEASKLPSGKRCTVRMQIKSVLTRNEEIILNSGKDLPDSNNLVVLLSPGAVAKYRNTLDTDIKTFFEGKTLHITSILFHTKRERKPLLIVFDTEQIVEAKQ